MGRMRPEGECFLENEESKVRTTELLTSQWELLLGIRAQGS